VCCDLPVKPRYGRKNRTQRSKGGQVGEVPLRRMRREAGWPLWLLIDRRARLRVLLGDNEALFKRNGDGRQKRAFEGTMTPNHIQVTGIM
jgi:hypothetical protein